MAARLLRRSALYTKPFVGGGTSGCLGGRVTPAGVLTSGWADARTTSDAERPDARVPDAREVDRRLEQAAEREEASAEAIVGLGCELLACGAFLSRE